MGIFENYDAVMNFAQYGLFQQLAQVDPIQCFQLGDETGSISPRVVSVPQACISEQEEENDEPFLVTITWTSGSPYMLSWGLNPILVLYITRLCHLVQIQQL